MKLGKLTKQVGARLGLSLALALSLVAPASGCMTYSATALVSSKVKFELPYLVLAAGAEVGVMAVAVEAQTDGSRNRQIARGVNGTLFFDLLAATIVMLVDYARD